MSTDDRRTSRRGSATVRRSSHSQSSENSLLSGTNYASQRGSNTRNRSKRKRRDDDRKRLILIGVSGLIAIVLIIVLVFRFVGGGEGESTGSETALSAEAFIQDAAIDLRGVLDIGDSGTSAYLSSDEESYTFSEGVISIYGKTPAEIRSEIQGLYTWALRVVNDDASVGETVTPTVDPDQTTEAATMGDPENPDSSPQSDGGEEEDEDGTTSVITVEDSIEVPDLISEALDELLTEIAANEPSESSEAEETEAEETETSEPTIYLLSFGESANSSLSDVVALCSTMWYKAAKGASIGSFDEESNTFVMEGAENGFRVDEDTLLERLLEAITEKAYDEEVEVVGETISAESATDLESYQIISTYTTTTTDNSVRNKNIQIACEALNGTIVYPGEEFSFNDTVGERTVDKGYGEAAAYNNGEVVQEVGGGVCQVSSTLYNAVLRAGLKTTRRQSHTFRPTYVTAGFDATISWGGPDYCFANLPANTEYSNSESYAIGIFASYSDRTVTVSIYGRPVLKDGYTYELESEKIKDIEIVRKLIEPDSDQEPTTGTMGSQWETYLVVKKDGVEVERTLDHNTYYSGYIEYYLEEEETEEESESDEEGEDESEDEDLETVDSDETLSEPIEGLYGGPGATDDDGDEDLDVSSSLGVVGISNGDKPTVETSQSGPGIISDAPPDP